MVVLLDTVMHNYHFYQNHYTPRSQVCIAVAAIGA